MSKKWRAQKVTQMAAEDFFTRWAKKKTDAPETGADVPASAAEVAPAPEEAVAPEAKPLPTMDDVAKLTHDSDYSGFMAQGVDESIKRSAMKKLFTDPHFNIMDGLDVYIEDFSKFEPMTPAFIAGLSHAKGLMDPLSQLKAPLMSLLDMPKAEQQAEVVEAVAEEPAQDSDAAAEIVDETDPNTAPTLSAAASNETETPLKQDSETAALKEPGAPPRADDN
ncbi:hypothetical protein D3C72_68590 [compost metagenome]